VEAAAQEEDAAADEEALAEGGRLLSTTVRWRMRNGRAAKWRGGPPNVN